MTAWLDIREQAIASLRHALGLDGPPSSQLLQQIYAAERRRWADDNERLFGPHVGKPLPAVVDGEDQELG